MTVELLASRYSANTHIEGWCCQETRRDACACGGACVEEQPRRGHICGGYRTESEALRTEKRTKVRRAIRVALAAARLAGSRRGDATHRAGWAVTAHSGGGRVCRQREALGSVACAAVAQGCAPWRRRRRHLGWRRRTSCNGRCRTKSNERETEQRVPGEFCRG